MQATGSPTRRSNANQAIERKYRLIDGSCEPHRQLDGQYSSLDEAIADAIAWIGDLSEPDHPASLIGVEVTSGNGDWRTCRVPGPLLCPLHR
ncbi:hypothetical protein [Synechococcus sp. CBW1108]|uniref:hypothetical protein n=1 Tax=Synechococcus sp. CBW1108 TaxID=1353147 RepID=UPI0018CF9610|nr:hypothetical protein [Synechococcus sp. CBW1108]QPN70041.1 hypothetical protein H8F27_16715 [Synechococcus sp. CBW1108]